MQDEFNFNKQNIQKPSGNPLITPQEKRIYQRPYLPIDRCSLARSQRLTDQLSAKPNFETPPPRRNLDPTHKLTS